MNEARRVAWLTVEEMLGKTFSGAITGTPSASTYLRGDGTWAATSAGTVNSTDIADSTATGRAVIVAASQAAARTAIGAGTSSFAGDYSSLSGIPSTFTPAAHTHPSTDISDSTATGRAVIVAASQAAARAAIGAGTSNFDGVYASLTSAPSTFAPSAHATSHKSGGTDAIKLDELAAPTDVTTLNASITAHGLMMKYPNNTTTWLRADGTWTTVTATAPDIALNLIAPSVDELITAGYGAYVPDYYEIADQKYLECGDGAVMEIG